ncbi:hypothetical protein [Streptomyces sp. NBC_01789]|nr:hypothetical protein [Streptomyces sp. NBC_01789]MCX4451564.1 hypothetical protein [Streptomyces sp. NBC_01789]
MTRSPPCSSPKGGRTTAGEMRAEAVTLLAEGYQSQAAGDAAPEPQH